VIEALSSGIPVITTQIALGDVLKDKHNCLIIRAGSSESISDTLEWFNHNPEKIQLIRDNAIRTGEQYTWREYRKNITLVANSIFPKTSGTC